MPAICVGGTWKPKYLAWIWVKPACPWPHSKQVVTLKLECQGPRSLCPQEPIFTNILDVLLKRQSKWKLCLRDTNFELSSTAQSLNFSILNIFSISECNFRFCQNKIKQWVHNLCKKDISVVDSLLEKWNEKCLYPFSMFKLIWLDVSNWVITLKICKIILITC